MYIVMTIEKNRSSMNSQIRQFIYFQFCDLTSENIVQITISLNPNKKD